MSKSRCAKCGAKANVQRDLRPFPKATTTSSDPTKPWVILNAVRIEGELVELCQDCIDRLQHADQQPADPAKVVDKPGPSSPMRISPRGTPLVVPSDKPIEIARPPGWRRS